MKKIIGVIVVIFTVVVAGFFLLGGCEGFGLGGGKGDGDGNNKTETPSQTVSSKLEENSDVSTEVSSKESVVSEEESEQSEPKKVEITVSGRDYLYQNNKISLDDFMKELEKYEKDTEIVITSDNTAAKNTMDDLTDKLDSAGYKNYHKSAVE